MSGIAFPAAFEGVLYDGRSAAGRRVVVVVDGVALSIVDAESRAAIARADVRADAPIPGVARRLLLPGGATIDAADDTLVEALWPAQDLISRAAFWLESRWSAALCAVLIIAAFAWLVVARVLPLAAEPVARSISPRIEQMIGKQALKSIDATLAKPSELPAERRKEIEDEFEAFVDGEPGLEDARLEFRRMGAPNAFAVPGGVDVITDEMVKFAGDDGELFAAIAHELGHLQAAHAMRLVLQQSGIAVLVTALAADAAGMTFLAAAMPAAILTAGYSREFELEADRYAYGYLKRHGSSPAALAQLLRRLAEDRRPSDANDPLARYLSTHPALTERIRRADEAAR